jgi:hypothetical protein
MSKRKCGQYSHVNLKTLSQLAIIDKVKIITTKNSIQEEIEKSKMGNVAVSFVSCVSFVSVDSFGYYYCYQFDHHYHHHPV